MLHVKRENIFSTKHYNSCILWHHMSWGSWGLWDCAQDQPLCLAIYYLMIRIMQDTKKGIAWLNMWNLQNFYNTGITPCTSELLKRHKFDETNYPSRNTENWSLHGTHLKADLSASVHHKGVATWTGSLKPGLYFVGKEINWGKPRAFTVFENSERTLAKLSLKQEGRQ